MIVQLIESSRSSGGSLVMLDPGQGPAATVSSGRVLVVEDDVDIREAMVPLLTDEGYQVSYAGNGQEALQCLRTEELPDIILLDLRMPVMNGWEFRAIQRDDPRLSLIPVVTFSADGSPQAAAISAHARLRKPLTAQEILTTIARVLAEAKRRRGVGPSELERLVSIGHLAANIGHEINNPLAIVLVNMELALGALELATRALTGRSSSLIELAAIKEILISVCEMLRDGQVGGERIRDTIRAMQRMYEGLRMLD